MTPQHVRHLAPVLGLVLAAGCGAARPPGPPPIPAPALAPAPLPPAPPPATVVAPPAPPPASAVPPPPPVPAVPAFPASPPPPRVPPVAPAPLPPATPPVAVPPPEAPSPEAARVADEQLAALVEQTLAADPILQSAVIEAEAHAGQVILKGTVPTYRERARAIDLALRVPGVKSVRLRLVLQPP